MSLTDDFLRGLQKKNATTYSGGSNKLTKDFVNGVQKKKKKDEDDIAPVRDITQNALASGIIGLDLLDDAPMAKTVVSLMDKEKDDEESSFFDGWFKKGNKDVSKAILGTLSDLGEDLTTGIVGLGEKIVDAGAWLAPVVSKSQYIANGGGLGFNQEADRLFEEQNQAAKEEMSKFIAKDLYDEGKVAKQILSNLYASQEMTNIAQNGGMFTQEDLDRFNKNRGSAYNYMVTDMEKDSVLDEKSDSLVQSAGQLGATAALSAVGVPWYLITGASTFGSEAENALNQGATFEEAGLSATISAGAEILTEKISGGIKFGGKTLDEGLTKLLSRNISNRAVRTAAKLGIDMAGEGGEEILSGLMSAIGQKLTYAKEKELEELFSKEDAWESFIGGAVLGGVGSATQAAKGSITGVDSVTELTKNEQKVVDKLYEDALAEEAKKGKVTQKQKAEIYDDILYKLEKGYIDTDIIEEVLGGDSYNTYKETLDSENALTEQEKKLNDEFSTLNKMVWQEMTGEQHDRREELRGQLEELRAKIADPQSKANKDMLKAQLTKDVYEMSKGDRLVESFFEQVRSKQKYQADLSQYEGRARDVIKKVMDSGLADNSNQTHEFWDWAAKMASDLDTDITLAENEQLLEMLREEYKANGEVFDESQFEGQTIDGYASKNGIVLNAASKRALNFIVGHEVTHKLEKTKHYGKLQKLLLEYAKDEYESRFKKRSGQYSTKFKADDKYKSKVDMEVTGDLVGDYLFTDKGFIDHLTKDQNVFQQVWNEIKYMAKIATAGSEQAKQLEKVKREFERAYREANKKAQSGVQFSVGYHAGDLGKSEGYHMQGGDRSTGHFGTGTYFVGDEAKISGNDTYGKRPHETVEFDNYNLYKVRNDKEGYRLHDYLHALDSGVSQEFLDAAISGKFRASNLRSEAYNLAEQYETKHWDDELEMEVTEDFIGASIRAMSEVAEANGIEFQNYDEWLAEQSEDAPEPSDSDYDFYQDEYYNYLKDLLVESDNKRNKGYDKFRDAQWELRWMFGEDNVNRALQAVVDHQAAMEQAGYSGQRGQDSRATVFMKALGYEGIDVRGTGLDNTTYGSVIYDLKGEDLARKKEIGTAKYSVSDSDGKQLTKEQQDYFKDSKMRDENGNLKVMYHGSQDAGFHVFDAKMSDDDTSFFFVDRNDVAASYSGTTETYEAKTIRTAEDMNNFLAEIGYDHYEAVEKDGKFELLENNEHVAWSDTAQGIYEEFCWYEGVGEGDANYKVYLNLTNPLEVDAQGRNWNNVSREYSQEIYDAYQSLTDSEKNYLSQLASWEDIGIFRDEILDVVEGDATQDYELAYVSAYNKLGGKDADLGNLFAVASEGFTDESIRENAVKRMNTRDYAQKAKVEGYDGVIFKNIVDVGGYGGYYAPATVAIAFDSNQIKSTANAQPTTDPDIRYSVSEAENQKGLNREQEVVYSISYDSTYMDNAIKRNEANKGKYTYYVDSKRMEEAKVLREKVAARMNDIKDRGLVGLPEDMEGNTYIANSSYDGTEENTTICPRSLAAEAFVDAVSEYLGRPLTVKEQIYISQDLQGRSLTPECTYCYVATDRKAYRAFLGEYINQRDSVLQKLSDNPNADVSRSGELYKEFLNGRKDTNPMYNRFKMWVDAYQNGTPMVDASHLANINRLMGDIKSEFGEALKPQIVDAMKYAQSASWAKKRINYVAYNGHILNWKQDRINKLNSHYGLRMYSFSDFHPAFVLENMQMITDASVRGLKMLGYTKDTDFVDIFAPSGMNINVSTFGFESGGNVYENNLIGAEWEKAKALRAQYPNVGVTFVATNDTLVNWALEQDWIDVVIPYHLVRTGAEVAEAFKYTNYTSESADTKTKDWVKGDKKFIAPTEHNNDLATYLAALEKNHLKPRFERFIDNPNYMKLVNECRQPASMSKPVQPVFNEEAAMKALAKLEANGYYQPIGGSVDRMYEIAAEVAEDMTNQLAPAMSVSDIGEQHKQYGRYNVYAKDMLLDKGIAPVAENATGETISKTESVPVVGAENETTTEELFPDNLAPVQSELEQLMAEEADMRSVLEGYAGVGDIDAVNRLLPEYEEIRDRIRELEADENQRADSLTDEDAPPVKEAPYYGNSKREMPKNPFADREWDDVVGTKNRSVKAYMYEHPEVKPFFQEEAMKLLGELNDTTRGERFFNDQVYYESGGEKGITGVKRHTSESMETLLDDWGMSYAEIEKGLKAIIEDNGAENITAAKKIEFMLNNRLLNGYKNFYGKGYIEANQDYIDTLEEMEINSYSKEAFDSFMATADQYAPVVTSKMETTTPLAKATPDTDPAPIFESKDKDAVKGQTTMFEPPKPNPKVASVLTEESAIQKEKSGIGGKLVSALVDKGMVFENLSLETGNHEVQAKWNYALPSNTEARAQYFMEHGADGVKPLKDIKKTVEKSGKTEKFYDYLYHVHNIDRMTLEDRFDDVPNKTVFGETITADVSRSKVAEYEKANPEFKNWANDVYAFNKHLRNLLVENDIISQETADLWEKMYPHYVPIRRVDTQGQNISVPLDSRKTGVNNPVKRAIGGSSDIMPLFETMAQRAEQTYRAIARNSFGIELKNTLGTTIEAQKDATGVDEMIDTIEAQEDHLLKPGSWNSNPTFTVFENGERVEFEITEDMYNALKPADGVLAHRSKAIGKVGDMRRNLLTVWNPVFALYRNPIKDMQDVAVNSQHAVKTYLNVPNAIYQMAAGGKYATEYHQNGGKSNTYFDSRTNKFKAEDNIFKKVFGMPVRAIETAGEFIEEIPRLAEYIASRKNGRSVERSMLDAARVTTNFAAGGDFTKFLNSHGFTFLNASVQGASQHVRNIREAKQEGLKGYAKVLAKYAIAGLPTVFLNGLLWDDDEEYEELSDYVKQNYYVVAKTQDGKFVRIPKGRTAAVMGELMEQMGNLVTGNDEVDFSTFNELFWNNIAPNNPIENNILAPIMQVANNEAWYGGDLVPSRLQDLPAEEQFDESTDSISKWLGEKTGFSPYKINYLLDQYSGGLGDVFLPMLTPEAESGDDSLMGNMLAPWKKELTTDMVLNNKNPGDFYDLRDELEVISNSKDATEEDKMKSMYMDSVSWEMSDLYKQKREIQSGDLPDDEKYEAVRGVQEKINELAKTAMQGYNDVTIEGLYSEVGNKRYNMDAESGKWYEIRKFDADGSVNYYYQKEQNVTRALGISYAEYWNNREEYNYAYDKPEQYALSQAVGGYQSYRGYTKELWNIKADKDASGKSISGSRKAKVIDYLNNLDADYYTKIILFKNEYNADDTYNMEIINYLNGRDDISYKQMEAILKYLGFEVDANGNISW